MTPNEMPWALVAQWPADGKYKDITRWNIRAAHIPATPMRKEQLVIEHDGVTYVRYKIGTKWALPQIKN